MLLLNDSLILPKKIKDYALDERIQKEREREMERSKHSFKHFQMKIVLYTAYTLSKQNTEPPNIAPCV